MTIYKPTLIDVWLVRCREHGHIIWQAQYHSQESAEAELALCRFLASDLKQLEFSLETRQFAEVLE